MDKGRSILLDEAARSSDPDQPAFIARPEGAPVYHGFPVVSETNTEGWQFGAITEFIGAEDGDGYVVAPDGSRAGLVWSVGDGAFDQILPASAERWGVYAVWFQKPMNSVQDLIANFQAVLPQLKQAKAQHGG